MMEGGATRDERDCKGGLVGARCCWELGEGRRLGELQDLTVVARSLKAPLTKHDNPEFALHFVAH